MRSLNQVSIIAEYLHGSSISEIAKKFSAPRSTIRFMLKRADVLRSRADGVRLAATKGKLGKKGPRGPMSQSAKQALSNSAKVRWEGRAVGTSLKASGYVEHTTGESKGRSVHVTTMEQRLGRRLRSDEVVHHIDGNRSNNDINNLALMTRSAHTRLHRREDALSGNFRERNGNGRFI